MESHWIINLFKKCKNRISSSKNKLWKYINIHHISINDYIAFANANAFKDRLQTMLGNYDVILLDSIDDNDRQYIINSAEQALRHEFDLLGSGPVKIDPIDWHIDFKCGAKWDKRFYQDIRTPKGADLKMPWELSRCQHLIWLGEAYLLTSEPKYAKEIIDEISYWIEDNPFMYSVNWKCAMDVAFRAVNWMIALNMISRYDGFDDSFTEIVCQSLWQHGFYIYNNLEKQIPYSNNHYVSDIVGLLYIGGLFRHTCKGVKWFRYAWSEYISETRKQVLPSGVHYERSLSYHRLMAELLSYPVYMIMRIGIEIPYDILERIQCMYAFIANYTKPNGYAPLIADNDDGRFIPLIRRDFRIHNYLNDSRSIENRFISCGNDVLFNSAEQRCKVYSDAGFAIIRKENHYLFICNSGYSKCPNETDINIGTHTHNDLLSFEYSYKGNDIIIDPGTYIYTSFPTIRNQFRSTLKHNTVVVDGEEQNILPLESMFLVVRNVRVGRLETDNEIVKGSYETIKGGLFHERSFCLYEDSLLIKDYLAKKGKNHVSSLVFNLAENIRYGDNVIITCNVGNVKVIETTWSPSYGIIKKTNAILIKFQFDDCINVETRIIPKGL